MSGTPSWDKITGPLGSTTTAFGGNWANLISDYFNGVNIALIDASKAPLIGTLTRYVFEKLSLLDTDSSHSVVLSVDDIDTGPTRKIRIRRMNTPYEEDFAVLEQLGQTLINKNMSGSANTFSNIPYSALTSVPSTFAPSAHATSHKTGGSDSIKIDELAAPTDVTTLNSTTSAHGLLKKLDNTATHYMDGTGAWSTPAGGGGGSFTGQIAYSYIIYKSGSNYIAYNTVTNTEQYSNTTAATTFNSVISAMNTAGGGVAFVKNAVYPIGASIILNHFTGLVGEDMEKTILRLTTNTTDNQLLRYWAGSSSTLLEDFTLSNLKLEIHNSTGSGSGETQAALISSGSKNCKIDHVWIKSFSTPSSPKIGFFWDTGTQTNNNENLQITFCKFEGPCGGEDFLGTGKLFDAKFNDNIFINCTSQAIGIGGTKRSEIKRNQFVVTGNAVGYEDLCEHNDVSDNSLWGTSGIKLSQEASASVNISRNNRCCNNHMSYGLGGVEAGISTDDNISFNYFYRCQRNGIRGSFNRCTIRQNTFEDGNFDWATQTLVGESTTSQKVGGIVCFNNTTPLPNNDYNDFSGNRFLRSGVTFTDEVNSTSETSEMGGLIIDTNYNFTVATNLYGTLNTPTIINYGKNLNTQTDDNPWDKLRRWAFIESDFLQDLNQSYPFDDTPVGAGSGVSYLGDPNAPGMARLTTGTTTTGSVSLSSQLLGFMPTGGELTFLARIRVDTLSVLAQRYIIRIGFGDSTSAASTDGVYFEYDEATSANWRIVTANNGTRTLATSGTAVTASASGWVMLKIVVNAAGTSASFYVNGTQVTNSPIATNLPASTREFGIVAMIVKSLGTTTRFFDLDMMGGYQLLSTPRIF